MKKVAKVEATAPVADQPTITFNNKVYQIGALPADVQELIGIHQSWTNELGGQRREVFKLEAALRGLLSELELRFNAVDAATASTNTVAPTADATTTDAVVV